MDHTLINNDCDVSWKVFMIRQGLAPADAMAEVDRYFALYQQARLPFAEFCAFQLAEFTGRTVAEMQALAAAHFTTLVQQTIYPQALALVRQQLAAGDRLCLLTATNRIIAEPIAAYFGFPDLLATELELDNGRFTGRLSGPYCGGPGKLVHAEPFCARLGLTLRDAWYYGDSLTDIPALEGFGHPVVANPGQQLRALAHQRHWPVLDF
jgi:HAD superfamily hydrolase (TIGR01490 family)